jgi:hypothetical protein
MSVRASAGFPSSCSGAILTVPGSPVRQRRDDVWPALIPTLLRPLVAASPASRASSTVVSIRCRLQVAVRDPLTVRLSSASAIWIAC